MSNRRFEMYHFRQVLMRLRQGDSDRDIARSKTMGRKKIAQVREVATARGWLAPEAQLPDDATLATLFARQAALPVSCVSTLEPWRDLITQWHNAGVQGTTIHATLTRNHGYTGSLSSVYRFLTQLISTAPPDVPLRLTFLPGEAAQVDFGAGPLITDVYSGETLKTWFFVITLCWSRHQYVEMVRDQTVATWLRCHRHAFQWFAGVPAKLTIDNAKCAITRACTYDPQAQRSYAECAEGYGFKIDACPPRDPQKKGIVEAGVKYVKGRFLPLREFRDLHDANRQLREWVMSEAGNRIHGTTRQAPLKRFVEVEKALLKPLPDALPELASWTQVKVHRDAHVQHEKRYYSVPFRLAGGLLWLKATDTMVSLYRDHELVATHARLKRPGLRSTVADHMPPDAHAWQLHDTQWCLTEAQRIGPECHAVVLALFNDNVLIRLRAVQGILRLVHTFGAVRLEAACLRANHFATPSYRAIKTILQKGLDQQHEQHALSWDAPVTTYTQGGRFCRDTHTLMTQ